MISWLQTNLEKHLKWVFIGLLAVIIVSFVFTIGAAPGIGEPDAQAKAKDFYGFNLNDRQTLENLQQGVILHQILGTEPIMMGAIGLEDRMLSRAVMLHLANELQIPKPDEVRLKDYLKTQPLFQDPQGQFSDTQYQHFLNWVKANPQFTEAKVATLIDENYQIHWVIQALEGPGYILPYEAEHQVEVLETQWHAKLAKLSFNKFNPTIAVDEANLEAYYLSHSMNYEIPEQLEIGYVVFEDSQYLDKISAPSEDTLHQYFEKNLSAFKNAEGTAADFNAEKEQVLKSYEQSQAHALAAQAANDFTYALFEQKIPMDSDAFQKMLSSNNLQLAELPLFDADHIPGNTIFKSKDLRMALALDPTVYYSDPIGIIQGYGVLIYKGTTPSRIPDLSEVRKDVIADYRVEQKKHLFSEEGPRIQKALTAAIAEGKTFDEAAQELQLEAHHFEPFSFENPPTGFPMPLLEALPSLEVGKISQMRTADRNGYWIYLQSKEAPKIDTRSATFKAQSERMAEMTRILGAMSAIQEMVRTGLDHLQKDKHASKQP